MYERIVFIDGHEGTELADRLREERKPGDVIATLKDRHSPGRHETTDAEPWGSSDETFRLGGYVLAWNRGLGYVSLQYDTSHTPVEDDPDFRFFRIKGESNVAAVFTNAGLYGSNREHWTGDATDPVEAYAKGAPGGTVYDAIVPVFDHDNSGVCNSAIHPDLLGAELTEAQARAVHPRLFSYLEQGKEA